MTTEPGLMPPPTGAPADVPRLAPTPVSMPAPTLHPTVPVDGPALPPKAPKADGIRDTSMIELPPILRPTGPPPAKKERLFSKGRLQRVGALIVALGIIVGIGVFVRQRLGDATDTTPTYTPVAAGVQVQSGELTFVMPSQPFEQSIPLEGEGTAGLVGRSYAVSLPTEEVEVRTVQAQRDSSDEDLAAFCNGVINELDNTAAAPVASNTSGAVDGTYRQSVVWTVGGGVMTADCIAKDSTGVVVIGAGASTILPATVAVVQSVTIAG
ncbi:MAG: hypothetical protein RL238_584 [Actinomycetota bacterium]|jgi:hypothetical protein